MYKLPLSHTTLSYETGNYYIEINRYQTLTSPLVLLVLVLVLAHLSVHLWALNFAVLAGCLIAEYFAVAHLSDLGQQR